tara:strand:+ start:1253 stop:1768 length:516 start_codon:yes stop_codon:yes gene_type:complete
MPNARRVIFSTYVAPTQSLEMEETSIRKTLFQASPNGTLGGKGIATINATQWGDGWTSFFNPNAYWEDQSDVWELQGKVWDGILALAPASPTDLTDDSSTLAFLYIKNTSSVGLVVSLNGTSGNYYITVPAYGSVHLRGADGLSDSTNLVCNEVFVKSHGKAFIEWIIAKA